MAIGENIDDSVAGGGEKPTPPKGYTLTTPQQRQDWNNFLDYMNKQPDIKLDDPQTGMNLLNQYKQQNPTFSITPEMVPYIQYEQNQLRTGDAFGNLTNSQLQQIRSSLPASYLANKPSEVTGQIDPLTTKLYYPQFKRGNQNFGTDIENYIKSPEANNIPLPDYNDSTSRLNYAKKFTAKYGPLMSGRGDTPLRINEIPETASDTSKNLSTKEANKYGLDPALLYSSAMEEGMSGMYPDKNGQVTDSGDDQYPVSGFANFGLDNFTDKFPELIKKGYLSKDFTQSFKKQIETNEQNQKVNSANFKTVDAALQAKAAMIKDAQDYTEQFAQKNNISLSDKAKQFFTLINFNAGEGNMHKMMMEYFRNGYLKDDNFLENRPSSSWKVPYENVIRRIKMANALKQEGLF